MDRLLRWVRDIRQATYFDIQNVSDYFWGHTEEYWDLKSMTLAPPFDFFTTRYTLPTRVYSKERGWTDFPRESHGQECLTVFRVVDHVPPHYRGSRIIWADDGLVDTTEPGVLVDHARWHVDIWLFMAHGRQVSPPCCWFAAIDDQGRVARQQSGKPAFWLYEDKYDSGLISIIPVSFLHVSALALTFLNCRNVEVVKPPPPTKKRLPRKLKFESRYHKIRVNAIGQRREGPGRREPTGISQGLHIVRGHFREYGPDYGKGLLFGKHAGRYWVASHFKGDAAAGIVTKDYEVNPPQKEE